MFKQPLKLLWAPSVLGLLAACGGDDSTSSTNIPLSEDTPFTINFKAINNELDVNCDNAADGIGPDDAYSIGVTDLRFYISNVKFYDAQGLEITTTLDDTDFQLNHTDGSVALIDFTDADSGYCSAAQEGTARTNTAIHGKTSVDTIASLSFDVGVPQTLMKSVIEASDNVADTPSPLGEMHWSWAGGYRHFVMNFVAMNNDNNIMVENSDFHIGSRDCGSSGKALSDLDTCGLINTPVVMLDGFDPNIHTVTVNLASIFENIQDTDFVSDIWTEFDGDESLCIDERRNGTSCVSGQNFGVQCHSASSQSACGALFPNFGIDLSTGTSDSITNVVFDMQ